MKKRLKIFLRVASFSIDGANDSSSVPSIDKVDTCLEYKIDSRKKP